jgi:hypothetical protein
MHARLKLWDHDESYILFCMMKKKKEKIMWHEAFNDLMTTEMHSARCLYVRMEKNKKNGQDIL